MADKKREEEEFKVADRRRFLYDGDVHDNPERTEEPQTEEAAAPPAEEPKKAEVREFPKREAEARPEPSKEGAVPSSHPFPRKNARRATRLSRRRRSRLTSRFVPNWAEKRKSSR